MHTDWTPPDRVSPSAFSRAPKKMNYREPMKPAPPPAAEYVAVASLRPWAKNPRKNDPAVKAVADSIKRFGFGAPLIARRENGEIIAGHTRLKAAIKLGLTEVPVRYLDLSEAEAHALALADNKVGELAEWDDAGLADVLRDLTAADVSMDGLGFTSEEIAALIGGGDDPSDTPDPGAPEVEEGPAHSVAGEVYELGPHRLVCGDCRDAETVARLLGGKSINVAFTSPPYASQRKYDESSGFKPIPPEDYVEWFDAVQSNVKRHLAEDGSWFVNIKEHCEGGQRHLYVKDLTIAHVRQWSWMLVDEFVWKRKAPPGRWPNRLRNDWEPVFQFDLGASVVRHDAISYESDAIPSGGRRVDHMDGHWNMPTGLSSGMAHLGNVCEFASHSTGGHTAAFPVALPEFFIKAYSDPGDTVFDPFMGSGTTLIASAMHGRVAYGTEISPRYCDLIRRRWTRWAKEAGQEPGPGALDG